MDPYPPPLPADPNARSPVHPARGWLLVVIGVGLSLSMAYIANAIHQTILHNDDPGSHSRWNGSAEFTRTTFELFGAVFLFGLVSVAGGVSILRTRRISVPLAVVMGVVVLVMIYLGYNIINANPPR